MLDVSFTELLLIVVVAVVFIGPKDLPVVLRALARGYAQLRRWMHEIHDMFEDLARESGLDEAKRSLEETSWIEGDDGDMYEAYDLEMVQKLAAAPSAAPPAVIPGASGKAKLPHSMRNDQEGEGSA